MGCEVLEHEAAHGGPRLLARAALMRLQHDVVETAERLGDLRLAREHIEAGGAEPAARQGIDQRRFYITGKGEADPIASNSSESGRAQNRRVEIQLSPIQG